MAREPDILIVTTDFIEGRPVRQHLGMVSSQAILGANVVLDLMAALRDFFGGRSKSYERVLARARADALEGLAREAREIGANAVIGVDLDYHAIGPNGQMLMVAVNGSAVVL
ncbi:YbjQ family protein [Phenylobacterium sp.]|jgi:uncharacterized protein YbjQ (UPF0145 family)|uniref:YbjQ family protein n=1 Tax=Phenylobacterium sp. TaxID=1871053 RepID=UPI002FDA82F7